MADPGRLPRDPGAQRAGARAAGGRDRGHAVAQPTARTAASSTTRRTARRPAPTSPGRSRTGRTTCWPTGSRASAGYRTPGPRRPPRPGNSTSSTATCRPSARWSICPPSGPPGSTHRRRPARRGERRLLGRDRQALRAGPDRGQPGGGRDVPVHDRWTGTARSGWTARRRSPMASLIRRQHEFTVATGNDTDADRHGIVTPDGGLINPNHYLAVAIDYLYRHRGGWPAGARPWEDPGQLVDDRSGGRGRWAGRCSRSRWVQVVRARAAGRFGGVRR